MRKVNLVFGGTRQKRITYIKEKGFEPLVSSLNSNQVTKQNFFLAFEDSVSKEDEIFVEVEGLNSTEFEQLKNLSDLYASDMSAHYLVDRLQQVQNEENEDERFTDFIKLPFENINFVFLQQS